MSNETQQTAVEQLISKIPLGIRMQLAELGVDFEQAKEMEKRDKIKFATDFFFWWYNQTSGTNTYEAVEKFYNETYGGNK